MDLSVWITYVLATIILSLSPGPGVFSSISSGLHHGFRLGVWNGVGMQVANMILVAIVSLGLGALLLASETLFALVKWVGVAYLVYLGIATWRAPAKGFVDEGDDRAHTAREVFMSRCRTDAGCMLSSSARTPTPILPSSEPRNLDWHH